MNDIIGLDANVTTALTIIVTGVVIPAVTAVLKQPSLPAWARRGIPLALAVIGAAIIVLLRSGGHAAEQVVTWLLLAATLIGIAQAIYAVMPQAWRALEWGTTSAAQKQAAVKAQAAEETDYADEVEDPVVGDMDAMSEE